MTNDLDTRARAGARALHDAVRDLPVATAPTRAPQRARVVLVATAAVALVALTVALVRGGEDEQRLSTDPSAEAPRLLLDPAPRGMAPTGAADLPAEGPAGHGTLWVYGAAAGSDPFGERDLGLLHLSDDGSVRATRDGEPDAEVDGHPAWISGGSDQVTGLRSVFVQLDGSTLGLLSGTLDDDQLLAAAGELDLDADPLAPPGTVAGLQQVGAASGAIDPLAMGLFPSGAGHVAHYGGTGGGDSGSIAVASMESREGGLAVAQWSLGATARPIEVDGADGWSGSVGDGPRMVVWQASSSALVALMGMGVDEAALLAAADTVRPASDAEWADLLATAHEVAVPDDAILGVSSEDVDGPAFAAYVTADGSVCLTHETANGGSDSCSSDGGGQRIDIYTERLGSGEIVLYGYTNLGTDGELRIEGADGSLAGVMEAFGEDGTLFAGAFTDGTLPAEVVVRSAEGAEVARVPVAHVGPEEGSSGAGFSGQGTPITGP